MYFGNDKETNNKIKACLEDLDWYIGDDDELVLKTRKPYSPRIGRYSIRQEDMLNYKKLCWSKGIIHHEDVLYFSYRLLKSYPVIGEVLSANYPYILLDEFQDTNPIQTEIIKRLSNSGIVGVIGDPAQSIYKFQGASRQSFLSFQLPGQNNYMINGNRRSGSGIVTFLNKIRGSDMEQTCVKNKMVDYVSLIEYSDSEPKKTIESFMKKREEQDLNGNSCVLARNNPTVTMLKNGHRINPWEEFEEKDSANRYLFLLYLLRAQEYGQEGMIDFAIKECMKGLRTDVNGDLKKPFRKDQHITSIQKRGISVSLLEYLITNRNDYLQKSVLNMYNAVLDFLSNFNLKLKGVRPSGFKEFGKKTPVKALIDDLKLAEEQNSDIRTIHKSKGAEFESVLVYLEDIDRLLKPNINEEGDETRLFYVACSRAQRFLCIATPPIDTDTKHEIIGLYGGSLQRIRVK